MNLSKNRMEAFSDGVIAIIITIMAFDLKVQDLPAIFSETDVWQALWGTWPKVLAYLLSFAVVAIFWLNHHALFDQIPQVDSRLVWFNMLLLFTLSLIPMPTHFLARQPFLPQAGMFYGGIMALNVLSFLLMRRYVEVVKKMLPYKRAIHQSNQWALMLYLVSMPLAFLSVYFSFAIFLGIPLWYFLPDRFHKA